MKKVNLTKCLKQAALWSIVLMIPVVMAYYGLEMRRYFSPKFQEVERQVFEQTPSFVHGKIQHLTRLRFQYDDENISIAKRASLRILIRSEASQIDHALLPSDLRSFLSSG